MHRRRHGRIRTPGLACRLYPGDRFDTVFAVENLSFGGAYVRSSMPLREGSPVVLDFSRPGSTRALRVTGRVVRALRADPLVDRASGMGICFDPLSPDMATRLKALLAAMSPGPVALEGDPTLNRPEALAPAMGKVPPRLTPTTAAPIERPRPGRANQVLGVIDDLPSKPSAPPPPARTPAPDPAKLMVQIRGLLLEVADWQYRADALEREKRELAEELERLKQGLSDPRRG